MAAGVNWVSDQWTAVMYMYLQSLDPSRWGWEALKAVALLFFSGFVKPTHSSNSLSKTLVWYWVCTFEVPCLGMVVIMMGRWIWKKETNLITFFEWFPPWAYTLANILAIHPASYLTFDRAFYLNIHVILFEIYIYIYIYIYTFSLFKQLFSGCAKKKTVFFQKTRFLILSKNHHHI